MTLFACHVAVWWCVGVVSTYHPSLHGNIQAGGTRYDQTRMTAAHRTLPLGTRLRVYSPVTDRAVTVTITDRGPYVSHRVLDLSAAAMDSLFLTHLGISLCRLTFLGTITPTMFHNFHPRVFPLFMLCPFHTTPIRHHMTLRLSHLTPPCISDQRSEPQSKSSLSYSLWSTSSRDSKTPPYSLSLDPTLEPYRPRYIPLYLLVCCLCGFSHPRNPALEAIEAGASGISAKT